jgi:hypothetical protein
MAFNINRTYARRLAYFCIASVTFTVAKVSQAVAKTMNIVGCGNAVKNKGK